MPGKAYIRLDREGHDNDPELVDVMIWDAGVRVNRHAVAGNAKVFLDLAFRDDIRSMQVIDGVEHPHADQTNKNDEFKDLFKTGGQLQNIKRASAYNAWNKRIYYGGLKGFATTMGRMAGVYFTYKALKDQREAIVQWNKDVEIINSTNQQIYQRDLQIYNDQYEEGMTNAIETWKHELLGYQRHRYVRDLYRYSRGGRGYTPTSEVQAIYSNLLKQISPGLSRFPPSMLAQMAFGIDLSPTGAVARLANIPFGPGAFPLFQRPSMGQPPTQPQKMMGLKVPSKTWENVAKGFFIAEVCLSGITVLLHLYDLMRGSSAKAYFRTTAAQVVYVPSLIRFSDEDSAFGRNVKTILQNHDIIGNVRTLLIGVGNALSRILNWVFRGKGNNNKEDCEKNPACMRALADVEKVRIGCYLETIKEWKRVSKRMINDSGNSSLRQRELYWFEKDYLQYLDTIVGNIDHIIETVAIYDRVPAAHWDDFNPKFKWISHNRVRGGRECILHYPPIFKVTIKNPGKNGEISSVDIIDGGKGLLRSGDGELSTDSGTLELFGSVHLVTPAKIKAEVENGKVKKVIIDNPGKGFYHPPHLKTPIGASSALSAATSQMLKPGCNPRNISGVTSPASNSIDTRPSTTANQIANIRQEETRAIIDGVDNVHSRPKDTQYTINSNATVKQLYNKYGCIFQWLEGATKNTRRALESRLLINENGTYSEIWGTNSLDDLFEDKDVDTISLNTRKSKTHGPHAFFETFDYYLPDHTPEGELFAPNTYKPFEARRNLWTTNLNYRAPHRLPGGGKHADSFRVLPTDEIFMEGSFSADFCKTTRLGKTDSNFTKENIYPLVRWSGEAIFRRRPKSNKHGKGQYSRSRHDPLREAKDYLKVFLLRQHMLYNKVEYYDPENKGALEACNNKKTDEERRSCIRKANEALQKKTSRLSDPDGDPALFKPNHVQANLQDMFAIGWKPGYCNPNNIKNFSQTISDKFFENPSTYEKATAKQHYKESICDRKSCGAVHAYSNVMSIGKNLKQKACGNVEVTWNFHPTVSKKDYETKAANSGIGGFLTSILDSGNNDNLKNKIKPIQERSLGSKYAFGTLADISIPRVWGNWTYAQQQAGTRESIKPTPWYKRFFRAVVSIITLGQQRKLFGEDYVKYVDPSIAKVRTAYVNLIAENYNEQRLYKKDFHQIGAAGTISKSTFSDPRDSKYENLPANTNNFNANTLAKIVTDHRSNLEKAYKQWADVTGWDRFNNTGIKIESVVSSTQRLSGVCHPIIDATSTGIKYVDLMLAYSGDLHDDWELVSNIRQKYQEISAATDVDIHGVPGLAAEIATKSENQERLLVGTDSVTSPVLNGKGTLGTGSYLAETSRIGAGGEWNNLVTQLDDGVGDFTNFYPEVIIKDVSYYALARPSAAGLAATPSWGVGNYYTTNTVVKVDNELYIAKSDHSSELMKHPTSAAGTSYWDKSYQGVAANVSVGSSPPLYNAMDFSGYKTTVDAKPPATREVERPIVHDSHIKGKNQITGVQHIDPQEALDSTLIQYKAYTGDVNSFHYTGTGAFKGVGLERSTVYSGEGYGCNASQAESDAYNILSGSYNSNTKLGGFDIQSGTTTILGHTLNTGVKSAVSGLKSYAVDQEATLMDRYADCGSTWDAVAGTGRWKPAPPCEIGRKSYALTGIGESASAAEANLIASKASETEVLPDKDCGCNWGSVINLSANWPTEWSVTGESEPDAVDNLKWGGSFYPANTPERSGLVNWLGYMYWSGIYPTGYPGYPNPAGYGSLLGIPSCISGSPNNTSDTSEWTNTINHEVVTEYFTCPSGSGHEYLHFMDENPDSLHNITDLAMIQCQAVTQYGLNGSLSGSNGSCTGNCTDYVDNPVGCSFELTLQTEADAIAMLNFVRSRMYSRVVERIHNGQAVVPESSGIEDVPNNSAGYSSSSVFDSSQVIVGDIHNKSNYDVNTKRLVCYPQRVPYNNLVTGTYNGTEITRTDWQNSYSPAFVNLKDYSTGTCVGCGSPDVYVLESIQSGSSSTTNWGAITNYSFYTSMYKPSWAAVSDTSIDHVLDTNTLPMENYFEEVTTGSAAGCVPYWKATMSLDCHSVVKQDGDCPLYSVNSNGNAMTNRAVVTGKITDHLWTYYANLYRNLYQGVVMASGSVPVVTGKCDWSATKQQIWVPIYPTAVTSTPVTSPAPSHWELSGEVDTEELYQVEYEKGGLMTQTGDNGQTIPQALQSAALQYPNKTDKEISGIAYGMETDTGVNDVVFYAAQGTDFSHVEGVPGKKHGDIAFIGGWPLVNQEFAKDYENISAADNLTEFGWQAYILHETNEKKPIAYYWNSKVVEGETVVGSLFDYLFRDTSRGRSGGQVAMIGTRYHTMDKFNEAVSKATSIMNVTEHYTHNLHLQDKEGKKYVAMVFFFRNAATACDSCIGHKVGPTGANSLYEMAADSPAIYFGENYRLGLTTSWELRSGKWEFEIPYVIEEARGMRDPRPGETGVVDVKPWMDMVRESWHMSQDDYTGRAAFYSFPGSKPKPLNMEVGCNIEKSASKLDKIIDYQNFFQANASYEEMQKQVAAGKGHEIESNHKQTSAGE